MPIPKAELHLHIEGTLEPELAFALAERNGVELPFASIEDLRAAYSFTDLQSFLDLYYALMAVLSTEQDFTDLAEAYLAKAAAQGVRHAEVFFDPQAHRVRGVPVETAVRGLHAALSAASERHGMSTGLIMCFLRDRPADEALEVFEEARPHFGTAIMGVGLDSAEAGNPPAPFREVYARAAAAGLRRVAHAGEEGPASYITESQDVLGAERIDHGLACLDDPDVVDRLRRDGVPLTVCPLSNVRLRVIDRIQDHPLRRLLADDLLVTVNSDDPAYFGGYAEDNFTALRGAVGLTAAEERTLARNSFTASFITDDRRADLLAELDAYTTG